MSPSEETSQVNPVLGTDATEQNKEGPTVRPSDRGVVPGMSSCRPSFFFSVVRSNLAKRGHNRRSLFCFNLSSALVIPATTGTIGDDSPHRVAFSDSPTGDPLDPQSQNLISETQSLATRLFGPVQATPVSSSWNQVVLSSIQTESQSGLNKETRTELLSKYEVKEDLEALVPPKLNKELTAALTPAVIKRDEYQLLLQKQVSACLNAFGSGVSLLLKPEALEDLKDNVRSALSFFSEGIHLLSDHQYRLSLTRRAFTKPSLNIIGKNAAETAAVDEFLFGKNFADTLKAAQICEKTGREMSKTTLQVGKKTLQPIRQTPQQRNQPPTSRPQYTGNRKVPARLPAARQAGTSHYRNRHHRSQSRTRARHRR
ncbi:PREDICTED: uncharacterized protein LOC105557184 [Vollenhovia emeryi]|uniref:uncharacterized protein LOC105557184 n=1 Tax=Vollenhovia emeryi TaxID=411798 RepID=UPI0005F3BAF5|nr:PREDICTED: uncharacterized protein LOC105557184 [Vollenhovia emeryi]